MNVLFRTKLLLLSGVLVLGGLGLAAPAVNAAPPPQLYPLGGPGQVTIEDNGGFTPGATVRLEVLTPDFTKVLATQYFTVSACGNISTKPNQCYGPNYPQLNVNNYVGDVQIMADESASNNYLGTFGGQSHLYPLSAITASAVGYLSGPGPLNPICSVHVNGSNVQATTAQYVQVVLADWQGHQLASTLTTPVGGNISAELDMTSWPNGTTVFASARGVLVGQPAYTTVTLCK